MKKKAAHTFVFYFLHLIAVGQGINPFALEAFVKKDRVILRWAPGSIAAWEAGNTYGYKIERLPANLYNEALPDSINFRNATPLSSSPLLPYAAQDDRWKKLIETRKNAAFVHSALYPLKKITDEKKKEMMFGLVLKSCDLDKELSKAHGLLFTDSSIYGHETYIYRLSIANPVIAKKYKAITLKVSTREATTLQPITGLEAKWGNKRVALAFPTATLDDYSGYWIERSEDSVHFISVNKTPFIRTNTRFSKEIKNSVYGDSLPMNGKKYFYRICGITYFGEPGNHSNVVSGMGKPDFTHNPVIDSIIILPNTAIRLKFRMSNGFDTKELKYYFVMRASKKTSGFSCVADKLPAATSDFTDAQPLESAYYKIGAVNIYNDTALSLSSYAKIIDQTPPLIPQQPIGKIDSNGVVQLTWLANTEKDLFGYRVYRSNSEKEQPFELTRNILTETHFTDTISLRTLTHAVYYWLRAVDKVYNNSGYSKYCRLLRPDKIAPTEAVITKTSMTDSSINLSWQKSSSDDVKKNKLLRKTQSGTWVKLNEWPAKDDPQKYTDTDLLYDGQYLYRLETEDSSGNFSFSESQLIHFKPGIIKKIQGLKFHVDRSKRSIELEWIMKNDAIFSFTIYKAKGNGPLQVYKTLKADLFHFIDKDLYPNNKYRYAIKATLVSGTDTQLSDILEVEY